MLKPKLFTKELNKFLEYKKNYPLILIYEKNINNSLE